MELLLTPTKTTSFSLRLLLALCLFCSLFGGLVSTLMSVYLPVVVRDLLGNVNEAEMGRVGAYINATYLYGWALGGIAWGMAGDRLGRLRGFLGAVLLFSVATLLTGLCANWLLVMACRFFAGFGVGGMMVLSTILLTESWPVGSRRIVVGLLSVMFPIGIIGAGTISALVPDWRQAFWIGLLPLLAAVLGAVALQEPSVSGVTRSDTPDTEGSPNPRRGIFHPAYRWNLRMGSLIYGLVLIGLWAVFSWLPTWVQSLFTDWTVGRQERGIIMMLLGMGAIIGGALSGFLSNRFGYRKTLMPTFAACFALCWLLFTTNHTFSALVYLETGVLAIFFGISQGTLSAFVPGLFPAPIRGTATGFCFNVGRLLTATAVFFVGTLVTVLGGYGNAVLTFSSSFLLVFAVLWMSTDLKASAE
jgi:MFS family permease